MPAVATAARPEPSPAYVWGTHRAGPPKARVASFGSKRGLADGRGAAVGSGRQSESIGLQQQPSSTDWKQGAQMSDLAVPLPPPPLPSSARRARSCTRSEGPPRMWARAPPPRFAAKKTAGETLERRALQKAGRVGGRGLAVERQHAIPPSPSRNIHKRTSTQSERKARR